MTSYVPNYENDILVSYAKADDAWVSILVNGIKVLLAQKLGGTDIFSLYVHEATRKNGNVEVAELIKKSAFFLVILSPQYSKSERGRDEFEKIYQTTKATPNRLIIVETGPIEEVIRNRLPDSTIKFWEKANDSHSHTLSFTHQEPQKAKYYQRLYEVVNRLEQELTISRAKAGLTDSEKPAVFIDAAPQDLDLAEEIKTYLEKQKISCKPPINFDASPAEIRKELDGNLLSCRDIIVFCDSVPDIWVEEHIKYYRKVLLRRDKKEPVKNLIVFHRRMSEKDKLKLTFPENLYQMIIKIPEPFECSSIEECLPRVLEELRP